MILLVSFAVRASFGVFQIPIAQDFGWPRAEFSMAIAIQNLAWGIGQPLFSAVAERFGDRRAIVLGVIFYVAGLLLSAAAVTPEGHQLLNILIGFGIAGTGFGVLLAIVGRAASPENRSMALGMIWTTPSCTIIFAPTLRCVEPRLAMIVATATVRPRRRCSPNLSWNSSVGRPREE